MTAVHDIIYRALDIARWAPSSHNSQPWRVEFTSPDHTVPAKLCIGIDNATRLRALVTLEDEMMISLGLFIGLFVRALDVAGLSYACKRLSQSDVEVYVCEHGKARPEALDQFEAIVCQRHTNRSPYIRVALDADQIASLRKQSWAPLRIGKHASVMLFLDDASIEQTADLVAKHAALDFANHSAWAETYAHIHFVAAKMFQRGRGFSIESLMGRMSSKRRKLLQFILHPLSMRIFTLFGLPRKLATSLADLTRHSSGILVLETPSEFSSSWDLVETGNRLAELWITATQNKIQLHPLSVLLQHDLPKQQLKQSLGLSTKPVFVARIGIAPNSDIPTPRVPTSSLLSKPTQAHPF
ncbi:hypothetical protein [Pseudovibrio sp. WM33]|uniref:hypothetical protein n=1 Tax=Pseudovibrio sp. WM33 TaxID=1735585 RepID=UPI0007AE606E|nr:hypothetical protein [Pseudovibrio sp. WM33]KZL24633.1 hypothetical protein PsWM33_02487 [Pseudovibrio sp. WM33]